LSGSLRSEPLSWEPYELVRSLRSVQDQIADGSLAAHGAQRRLMEQIAEQMLAAEPSVWKEKRNVRAAIIFVLSGGDPEILRHLLGLGVVDANSEPLVKGALAYGEGRADQAEKYFVDIDAHTLEASLAGQVALAQAMLLGENETARALKLLDEARLFAPGTLIEESALRREALLLLSKGDFARFESVISAYVRRFPRSVYGPAFFRQFAVGVADQKKFAEDPTLFKNLENILNMLSEEQRRDLYLAMAEEAVKAGRVSVAIAAAAHAGKLFMTDAKQTPNDASNLMRSRLYEGAALLVTEDFGRGIELLKTVDRKQLNLHDANLLDAALLMAAKLRWPPEPPAEVKGEPPAQGEGADKDQANGVALGREVMARARRGLTEADRLLDESKKSSGTKK
jgi:chemotaxis protein MotC